MVVQTHFPQKLSPKRYDQFLASGWFRGSIMLYKMELLCLENDLHSVINIRLNLEKHSQSKSLRKIYRKGLGNFRITTGKVKLNLDKEKLYALQKNKFKGFIHNTLREFLFSGFQYTVFDTREVCVYDGDKLIAASYFDFGEKSVASLLGVYDPEYGEYSLGILTMLIEIEYAKKQGIKWYYPGYILNGSSGFDYKLRLGDFDYYNSNKRWSNFSAFNQEECFSENVNKKCLELEEQLTKQGLEFKKWLYPYFGIGYMHMWDISFLKSPIVYEISKNVDGHILFVCYDLDQLEYQLFWCEHAKGHEHLVNMGLSDMMKENENYLLNLLRYVSFEAHSKSAERISKQLIKVLELEQQVKNGK